jgi:hypothetical protein
VVKEHLASTIAMTDQFAQGRGAAYL